MKAVFFDIDNTLTTTKSGATFKQNPKDIKVMDGVESGLNNLLSRGYRLFGVSNQGGVGAGHKFLDEAIHEMENTHELLPQLELICFCPDYEGNIICEVNHYEYRDFMRNQLIHRKAEIPNTLLFDSFRKPSPGMIQKITHDWNLQSAEKWMVGDRPEDEGAAMAAGIDFVWADTWRSRFMGGVQQMEVTSKQLEFLEGIKLSSN